MGVAFITALEAVAVATAGRVVVDKAANSAFAAWGSAVGSCCVYPGV